VKDFRKTDKQTAICETTLDTISDLINKKRHSYQFLILYF